MKKVLMAAVLTTAFGATSGCIVQDPRQYESPPVTVTVAKGKVTCQLYTKELVYWDRATQWPKSMSVDEADAICLDQGKRWKRGDPVGNM